MAEPRYEWRYLYGFVRPTSGALVWFLCNTVNVALFSAVLAAFAREVGAGPDKRIILLLDGAGWHAGKDLLVPEGLRLECLPPYSPELQPAEHLWSLTDQVIANRNFATLDALDQALTARCLALCEQPEVIRSSTCFQWWPKAA